VLSENAGNVFHICSVLKSTYWRTCSFFACSVSIAARFINCSRSSKYLESSLGLELLKVGTERSLRVGIVYVVMAAIVGIGGRLGGI
jgi:hypothetical protein